MSITGTVPCCSRPPLAVHVARVVVQRAKSSLGAWRGPRYRRTENPTVDDHHLSGVEQRRTAQALGGLGILPR